MTFQQFVCRTACSCSPPCLFVGRPKLALHHHGSQSTGSEWSAPEPCRSLRSSLFQRREPRIRSTIDDVETLIGRRQTVETFFWGFGGCRRSSVISIGRRRFTVNDRRNNERRSTNQRPTDERRTVNGERRTANERTTNERTTNDVVVNRKPAVASQSVTECLTVSE